MYLSIISKPINIPFVTEKCRQIYRDHPDLSFQISMVALNSIVLISKIYSQSSPLFSKFTFVSYNFVGVLFINRQIKDLKKNYLDFKYCRRAKDREKIIVTILKTSSIAINILLTGSLFAAAIFSLLSFPTVALTIYAIIKPIAIYSLIIEVGSQIYNYKINRNLQAKFTSIKDDQKIEKIVMHFIVLVKRENCREEIDKNLKRFSLHIFCQLDNYAINQLKKSISKIEAKDFYEKLEEDIDKRCAFTEEDLYLMAVGYAAMGIGRIWPESLAVSFSNWSISILHLRNLINLKYR